MRILLIGGNGFIGSPLASELRDSGHSVAIFHRSADKSPDKNVVRIQGDRNRLSDHLEQIQRFSPEVIVDLILSSGEQARQLISTSRKVARRVIAISSMDVYRAWGVVQQSEPGPLEALPLTEDSPPRTNRQLYPPETVKMMQSIFSWVDEHYDKIAVEAVEGTNAMIERAGQLCRVGGWTLIKVANKQQDMRMDVPTIGVTTMEKLREARAGCVVLEPGKTEDLPYSLPMISPLGEGRVDMWRTLRMRSRLPQLRTKWLDVFTTSARNPRCQSWHGRRRSRHRHTGRESLLCCPGKKRHHICCSQVMPRSI